MNIKEIAFTCYPVTDLARARHFYEQVLGLKTTQVFGDATTAWIEYDIGSGTLSIGNGAPDWKANAGGGCVGLEVEDFEAAVTQLRTHNVSMKESFETPVCHMVIISDPDGNSLIIHKRKSCGCGSGNCHS